MARSSVPSVESQRPSGRLAFLSPPETDESSPSPSDLPSDLYEPTSPLEHSRSESDELLDESSEPASDDLTSSRGSSGSSITSKAALRRAARKGVIMAGDGAHLYLARDEAAKAVDLYRADDDDAKSVGDPLANIAHRHGGLGDSANTDFADAIAALFGLAAYAFKQISRARIAAQLRAQHAAAEQATIQVDPDVPSTPYAQ